MPHKRKKRLSLTHKDVAISPWAITQDAMVTTMSRQGAKDLIAKTMKRNGLSASSVARLKVALLLLDGHAS
jgi:hypothetical protein